MAQHIRGDCRVVPDEADVVGAEDHHLFAVVAGGLELVARPRQAPRGRHQIPADLLDHGGPAGEHAVAGARQVRLTAIGRVHEIGLRYGAEHGPADGRVVEGRLGRVEAKERHPAARVLHLELDARVLLQGRQHVAARDLKPVDLAILQGRRSRRHVGDDLPLQPVEVNNLSA